MSKFSLKYRFGQSKDNPSIDDVKFALEELHQSQVSRSDSIEHPNIFLECIQEDDHCVKLFILDIYITGLIRFTIYLDQDDEEPETEKNGSFTESKTLDLINSFLQEDFSSIVNSYST